MARKPKAAPAKETETKTAKAEPKYGVNDLVEATGLQPASIRVALRDLGVEKAFGNKYGWNNQKDFKEVVAGLKERSDKQVGKGGDDEKPAPKKAPRKSRAKK